MTPDKSAQAPQLQFTFGSGFLHDHAGQIIDDPRVAIIELVANCDDAGANEVQVLWPSVPGKVLSITDDGTGMTRSELDVTRRNLFHEFSHGNLGDFLGLRPAFAAFRWPDTTG